MQIMLVNKVFFVFGSFAAVSESTGDLVLTTENGISIQNTVVIEPEAYPMLEAFVDQLREEEIGRWRKVI